MEEELQAKLDEQEKKLDAIYKSVEKMRKYFLWTFWITIVLFVLPLVGLIFVFPFFMSSYVGALNGNYDSSGGGSFSQQIDELQGLLE